MQRLEVSGAVRLIYRSLGVKGLKRFTSEPEEKVSQRHGLDRKIILKQWRTKGGFGVFKHPAPPKFRRPSKIVPNSTRFVKTVKNCRI